MDWRMDDWSPSSRVSPFRYLRINGYLLLPAAFRSLSRLSSALSAKASTLRSFLLDLSLYSVTTSSAVFRLLLFRTLKNFRFRLGLLQTFRLLFSDVLICYSLQNISSIISV